MKFETANPTPALEPMKFDTGPSLINTEPGPINHFVNEALHGLTDQDLNKGINNLADQTWISNAASDVKFNMGKTAFETGATVKEGIRQMGQNIQEQSEDL